VATNGVDNTDPGRGESWALPFATISNAVAYATTANDIVTVSNGTDLITAQIAITNAITVRGRNGSLFASCALSLRAIGPGTGRGYGLRMGKNLQITYSVSFTS